MKIKLFLPVKVPRREFKVSKSFKTKSVVTKRTLDVAEAFGIGVDEEKEFIVFKDFVVNVSQGDIVYITGDSGSGKSVLLRQLYFELAKHEEFGRVFAESDLKIDPEAVLIESVGKDTSDAINKLSQAGLNEAFLFLRRHKELSDGQKYRFKIAKLIDEDADVWIADEFCSVLDRVTARVVSYCLQETARRLGKTVIVATTHEDLAEDLHPTVHIKKRFGDKVDVQYNKYNESNKPCSLFEQIKILPATKQDYMELDKFHYRASVPQVPRYIFKAVLDDEIVGVILYSNSPLACAARTKHFGRVIKSKELNRDFIIIARVVVHPKFRSIGLGVKLVKDTMPLVGKKYVETIAVMARYNPFFAKAGMTEVPYDSDYRQNCRLVMEKLKPLGFQPELAANESFNLRILSSLSRKDTEVVVKIIKQESLASSGYASGRGNRKDVSFEDFYKDKWNIAHAIRLIAIGAQEKKFYVWRNLNP